MLFSFQIIISIALTCDIGNVRENKMIYALLPLGVYMIYEGGKQCNKNT